MCEARVYISDGSEEEKVMEDVVLVQPESDATYLLVNILGEQRLVEGHIDRIDFLKHTVHLSRPKETTTEG